MRRILVLGGYGAFGGRVSERLAREAGLELIIAGRSLERAQAFSVKLQEAARAKLTPARLDVGQLTEHELVALQPLLVVNASGPYQLQNYHLARACIASGVHYVDLADAREFVTGIRALNADALASEVLAVSGASTVPAISAAVIDAHVARFAMLDSVRIVIAPGNSFDPGLATTQSILTTLGRPFGPCGNDSKPPAYGWQGLQRRVLPGIGARWLGACDTPDLDLLPQRYPGLRRVEVYAALEVGAFHLGLWALSWLVRGGLVRHPERLARLLLRAKHALRFLGSDTGGMTVTLAGQSLDGRSLRVDWRLVARSGHGPYVPAVVSVILAKRLLAGTLRVRGAMPCLGLFALDEFLTEIDDLDITEAIT
jgi:hypothetical protein